MLLTNLLKNLLNSRPTSLLNPNGTTNEIPALNALDKAITALN
jgi:hypothetical protein